YFLPPIDFPGSAPPETLPQNVRRTALSTDIASERLRTRLSRRTLGLAQSIRVVACSGIPCISPCPDSSCRTGTPRRRRPVTRAGGPLDVVDHSPKDFHSEVRASIDAVLV